MADEESADNGEEIILKGKQRAFADAYIEQLNGTKAARIAKYKGNGVTLAQVASENLRKPNIRAYIDAAFKAQEISRDEVIARLTSMAKSDIDEFLDEDGNFDIKKARDAGKTHLIKEYKVKEGPKSKATGKSMWREIEVKLYPANDALDRISRTLGMDKPIKVDVSGQLEVTLESWKEQADMSRRQAQETMEDFEDEEEQD